jgi:hypothetical protein
MAAMGKNRGSKRRPSAKRSSVEASDGARRSREEVVLVAATQGWGVSARYSFLLLVNASRWCVPISVGAAAFEQWRPLDLLRIIIGHCGG